MTGMARDDKDGGVNRPPRRSLLRGMAPGIRRAARTRAVSEQTTLRRVLGQALSEYAAGTWTPGVDDRGHEHPER